MSEPRGSVVRRVAVFAVLYLLAAPIYVLRFLVRSVRILVGFRRVRRCEVLCPHCGTENAMDALATCRRCGATEFGSRLYCSNCRMTTPAFPCRGCSAMIRVL